MKTHPNSGANIIWDGTEKRNLSPIGEVSHITIIISVVVASAAFALDLSLPLGVAGGVSYVAFILMGIWFSRPLHIYILASIGSVLIIVGYFLSPSGGIFWIVLTNRGLALFAIWITALLIASRKRYENALRLDRDKLDVVVVKRTNELKQSQERFRDFADAASDWLWEMGPDLRFTYLSDLYEEATGISKHNILGKTREELGGPDENRDKWLKHIEDLKNHRPFRSFEYRLRDGKGKNFYASTSGIPIFDKEGAFKGYRGTGTDITLLIDTQNANERFLLALNHFTEGLALWDADGRLVLCNDRLRKIAGAASEDLIPGITYKEWQQAHLRQGMIPESIGREEAWLAERMEYFENPVGALEVQRDGNWYLFRLQRLPDGSTMHSAFDIHDMKLSEGALRQAQKMEAVGQLTGGIAHDFNNLLNIVMGKAELLSIKVEGNEKEQRDIDAIIGAVRRGAALTERLLAFSRQQVLSPQPTAVNNLVHGLEDMLQRTLGETVELQVHLGSSPCEALIDPHQFENALINLAINARHAMPNSGVLTIETADTTLDETFASQHEELTPGDYVEVTVSDTGVGMSLEVQERAFDPFFTTKDVGEGSGLGLSMVHGFAKQSHGHVILQSEEGHGTTVKLYLPRSLEAVARKSPEEETPVTARGVERILIVEDDEGVREIPTSILRDQGYEVVEAGDGEEAIKLLEENQPFDLLFTDIVLPGGMNGVEIADEARRLQPNIKVLYTTGYAEDAFANVGKQVCDAILLNKPYRQAELLDKVRAVLDRTDD